MAYDIDPQLLPLLDLLPAQDLSDVGAGRELIRTFEHIVNDGLDETGVAWDDRHVPGPDGNQVRVRVYQPEGGPPAGGRPGLVHIHGGGFVAGTIELEHGRPVTLVQQLGIVVVAVDYRLAPEDPFPAGLEDCYAALAWVHDRAATLGVDVDRIGVSGSSAGGGLAAGLALLARDRGGPALCFQLLDIPELDHRLDTASMRTFVDTPLWNRPAAEHSWRYYLGDAHPDVGGGPVSPYASPAVAEDLAGLPPAYIAAAEFDPLRDEGILYALRLLEAGVSVELHTFPRTFHGSSAVTDAAVSKRAAMEAVDALRRGLQVDG